MPSASLLLVLAATSSANSNFNELTKQTFFSNQDKTPLAVTIASVGSAANCNFTTIQAAIDSGVDEVRLISFTTYTENILIQNKSINLIGGYSSCAAANVNTATPGTNFSTIDAGGSGTVIEVINDTNTYDVNFTNLRIINGSFNFFAGTGGIILSGTGTRANFDHVEVENNTGTGIRAQDIDILLIKDSYIANNSNNNDKGGGIYCDNTFTTIYGKSTIRNNSANLGGGVYATNHCVITQYSGQPAPRSGSSGIVANNAGLNGGGIYADQLSTINLFGHEVDFSNGNILGDSTEASFVGSNSAENGGGIYLDGNNTIANLAGVYILSNNATVNGGGIYLTNNAQLSVLRYDLPCYNIIKCNQFNRNQAGVGITGGGAIYANNSSQFGITQSYFTQNTADFGNAILAIGNVTGTIEGSIFTNNNGYNGRQGHFVIDSEDTSNLTIGFNTFVDNLATTSTLGIKNAHIENVGNLFYEYPSGTIITLTSTTGTASATNYCLLSRDTSGLTGLNIIPLAADPFVDRNTGDFHLDVTMGQSAMDQCNTNTYYPSNKDIDLEPRGINLPLANTDGPYDIGADEFFVEDLFKNGFE